mgnify:CR=1 FL=1
MLITYDDLADDQLIEYIKGTKWIYKKEHLNK